MSRTKTLSPLTLVFFGSFQEYSAQVLQALCTVPKLKVQLVVTTPPQPMGRHRVITPNPVHTLAEKLGLSVFTPTELTEESLAELAQLAGPEQTQLFLTAGYGKLLPAKWLEFPTLAALNLHFSLLPHYRGANPAEWALLRDEKHSGVTLIEMSPSFDTGKMVAQQAIPIDANETRESLYEKLYDLGGQLLAKTLVKYAQFRMNDIAVRDTSINNTSSAETQEATTSNYQLWLPAQAQPAESPTPYAKRLQREDGFIHWADLQKLMAGQEISLTQLSPNLVTALNRLGKNMLKPADLPRVVRALQGFPGVWTRMPTTKGEKRMKILGATTKKTQGATLLNLSLVQVEGQQPAQWNQVKSIVAN